MVFNAVNMILWFWTPFWNLNFLFCFLKTFGGWWKISVKAGSLVTQSYFHQFPSPKAASAFKSMGIKSPLTWKQLKKKKRRENAKYDCSSTFEWFKKMLHAIWIAVKGKMSWCLQSSYFSAKPLGHPPVVRSNFPLTLSVSDGLICFCSSSTFSIFLP